MHMKHMKRALFYSVGLAMTALVAFGTQSHAADLNDHELYKIVTYTFNTGASSELGGGEQSATHFNPLMISRPRTTLGTPQSIEQDQFAYSTATTSTQGFAVSANINATSNLAFQGVIGVTRNSMNTTFGRNYDSSWEANLGLIYKLFDHLSYEMHFGFMDSGDIMKTSNSYSDVESVVMISNQLTMSF